MKAKLYAGAAFVILGLAAAYAMTSAMETEVAVAPGESLLSGKVTSATGEALVGIPVKAHRRNSNITVGVYTNAQGEYVFPAWSDLTPASYDVAIELPDFEHVTRDGVDVSEGPTQVNFSLQAREPSIEDATASEIIEALPGTDEQKLLFSQCSNCHSLQWALRQTRTKDCRTTTSSGSTRSLAAAADGARRLGRHRGADADQLLLSGRASTSASPRRSSRWPRRRSWRGSSGSSPRASRWTPSPAASRTRTAASTHAGHPAAAAAAGPAVERCPAPGGQPLVALRGHAPRACRPSAFAIAMLGAIESLLSAVVADGMTGHPPRSDAELVALGIGQHRGAVLRRHRGDRRARAHRHQHPRRARARRSRRSSTRVVPAAGHAAARAARRATCRWRRSRRCCCSSPGTCREVEALRARRCGSRRRATCWCCSPASCSPWSSTWWWR